MTNRNLNEQELKKANAILEKIRKEIKSYSKGSKELKFALNRKIYKELSYDERGKPSHRKKLKEEKRKTQKNLCAKCKKPLPEKYSVLDRINADEGYTDSNTKLIHRDCDQKIQESRQYR